MAYRFVITEIFEHPTTSKPGNYVLGYHPYTDTYLYKVVIIY